MCMPRIFGSKIVDGKVEDKKGDKNKCANSPKKKTLNQASVEFDDEDTNKRD